MDFEFESDTDEVLEKYEDELEEAEELEIGLYELFCVEQIMHNFDVCWPYFDDVYV